MRVDIHKFWIEGVLLDAYPDFHSHQGADLNHDGSVSGSEQFGDLDGNGVVGNPADYQNYLQHNREALNANVPFFRWGKWLSVENRIHQRLYLEADLLDPSRIEQAYSFISTLVASVNTYIGNHPLPAQKEGQIYYGRILASGMRVISHAGESLADDIHNHTLDCSSSSYLEMAIGDERNVVFNLVLSPFHLFLRGQAGNQEFNLDYGSITHNEEYLSNYYRVTADLVRGGIYLYTLNERQVESRFLYDRAGILFQDQNRPAEALIAINRAIELNPNHIDLYEFRSFIYLALRQFPEALQDIDRVIQINPNWSARIYYVRGGILEILNRPSEARAAYNEALRRDSNLTEPRQRLEYLRTHGH